ncbi:aminodeoxychorismate synthase component I [Nibricoccus aquaticus]|nr:aminodeoxychorismate synthase component I [Nibricoccus aquaticus]
MHTRELRIDGGMAAVFAATAEKAHAFFLESALPADGLGRYSFIGFGPLAVFRVAAGGAAEVTWADGRVERTEGEPLEELRKLHGRIGAEFGQDLQEGQDSEKERVPFAGGAVGFFSYEFGLRFEGVKRTSADDLAVAEAEWAFYDGVVVCEEASGSVFVATNRRHKGEAEKVLARIEREVRAALAGEHAEVGETERSGVGGRGGKAEIAANFSREGYVRAVGRVKEFIRSGDVYQINLSQRFETVMPCAAAELYRKLRKQSPAPYGCFLNFGGVQVAGVSPERFLRVEGEAVTTRPIKGTRPRGRDAGEDAALKAELAVSEKDRAELLMIVDLERNDLGRVCVPGSVRVENLYALEAHPTVWHQVAEVSGRLAEGRDVFDCIRAAFPGGSITGAPKIRAMQIIDELEPHRRHLYTGAMGYLGFDGRAELNIAIRTITCVGGRAYFHAGGGVVWDSDPESEYAETLTKAKALRAALTQAGAGGVRS